MLMLLLLFCELEIGLAQETSTAILLYEDQKELKISGANEWNFLTLKEKVHQETKQFDDFTICIRFNLMSNRGESRESIPLRLKSSLDRVLVINKDTGTELWYDSSMIYFSLNPVPPGNGWFQMMSFHEHADEVIKQKGVYTLWPIYKEEVNANQWHSMCFGIDIKKNIMYLVHNGKTQDNVTQPDIVREVNRGFDTTMVEPWTRQRPLGSQPEWWWVEKESLANGVMIGYNIAPTSGYFTDFQFFGHSLSVR
jgi:hypothetical protein